jgi:small subunit ribosomal protein S9
MAAVINPYIWGTGRRKTAVARVRIKEGTGKFLINKLEVDQYFTEETQRSDVRAPLQITEMGGRLDVWVNVKGSGKNSQSGAILLGLARALAEHREDLLPALRDSGFLTRDARMVERKHYGHKKARRSFQFSKR